MNPYVATRHITPIIITPLVQYYGVDSSFLALPPLSSEALSNFKIAIYIDSTPKSVVNSTYVLLTHSNFLIS